MPIGAIHLGDFGIGKQDAEPFLACYSAAVEKATSNPVACFGKMIRNAETSLAIQKQSDAFGASIVA
jgi:hypothetical protein